MFTFTVVFNTKIMYIISKHKDYYDGVVGSIGIDKTIVYERSLNIIDTDSEKPKEFKRKKFPWNDKNQFIDACQLELDHTKNHNFNDISGFVVGFCGKLYLGWKLVRSKDVWSNNVNGYIKHNETKIVYGYENVIDYVKEKDYSNHMVNYINYVNNYDPIHIFRDIKAPVFLYDNYRNHRNDSIFYINPILKDWEFYKVVDSFTAFQEISMFISGVLGVGDKDIVEVDDKYKISGHGFDKWSFRKEGKNSK